MINLTAGKDAKLIKFLCEETGLSFSLLSRKLREKQIKVNGERVKENINIKKGDQVFLFAAEKTFTFTRVFEDNNLAVLIKPKGIETIDAEKELNKEGFYEMVHRLDRNTEGVLVFGKTKDATRWLKETFSKGWAMKYYWAAVFLNKPLSITAAGKTFAAHLTKDAEEAHVTITDAPTQNSEPIETFVEVISKENETALLRVGIQHGKTHQIRAHLAYLGYPIMGDEKYGNKLLNKQFKLKYQELYAVQIKFTVPEKHPLHYLNNLNLLYKPKIKQA